MTPDADLVGRDDERKRIEDALSGTRCVAITGPAGVGKSALARSIGRDHDAIAVDGSAIGDGADVLHAIGRGLSLPRSRTDASEKIARALDAKGTLLVVDDVERGDVVWKTLQDLLGRTKRARFLVTTRDRLAVDSAQIVELAPLPLDEAVRLLRARGTFGADASDAVLHEIVERVDRLPLAIVLAAGRSRVLSVTELSARLGEPLKLLRGGSDPRHKTLERAIDLSWNGLDERERRGLAGASLFSGAFSADAFESVVGSADESEDGDALATLERLLDRSLLVRSDDAGAAFFRMFRGVRAFALARLRERSDEVALRNAYDAHLLRRATRASEATYGLGAGAALAELARLLPEIVIAFERLEDTRPAHAAALWVAAFDAVFFRDTIRFDDPHFDRAVDAADRGGEPLLCARTRIFRARAALERGPAENAEADLRGAIAIGEKAGIEAVVVEARRSLGWMELARGRPQEAIRELELALDASTTAHGPRGQADALAALGVAEQMLGEPERARDSLLFARAIHDANGETLRAARVDEMLALADPKRAMEASIDELLRAKTRHEERGQTARVALDLALLSTIYAARGDATSANDVRLRARAAARASGLQALSRALEDETATTTSSQLPWSIADEGRALVRPDGTRVDLTRHGSLRRVLAALFDARVERPGHALSAADVLAAGWPGERVLHDAGLLRVYSTIRRLRRMGLAEALITRDDGYLLDPNVSFARS